MVEVVEKVVRSKPFPIVFLFGPKHVAGPYFIEISRKLPRIARTQGYKMDRWTDKLALIKGRTH